MIWVICCVYLTYMLVYTTPDYSVSVFNLQDYPLSQNRLIAYMYVIVIPWFLPEDIEMEDVLESEIQLQQPTRISVALLVLQFCCFLFCFVCVCVCVGMHAHVHAGVCMQTFVWEIVLSSLDVETDLCYLRC